MPREILRHGSRCSPAQDDTAPLHESLVGQATTILTHLPHLRIFSTKAPTISGSFSRSGLGAIWPLLPTERPPKTMAFVIVSLVTDFCQLSRWKSIGLGLRFA